MERPVTITQRKIRIVSVVVLLALMGYLAYAHSRPAHAAIQPNAQVAPAAMLRAPATGDALPQVVGSNLARMDGAFGARFGITPTALASARMIAQEPGSGNVYLVPGKNGQQCIIDTALNSNCVDMTVSRPIQFLYGGNRIFGAVAQGVTAVSLTRDGTTTSLPLTADGGFAVDLAPAADPTLASVLTVTAQGGAVTVPIPGFTGG